MSGPDGSGEVAAEAGAAGAPDETTVRTSIVVHTSADQAFRVFTAEMSAWWPSTHHIGSSPMVATIVEPRVGGRWHEVGEDGSDTEWGMVLAWDPPSHFAVSWHLDGDFRYDPDARRSSRVDVRFLPQADGTTHVELVHSGLDQHGPTWRRLRAEVGSPGGWPGMLRGYAEVAGG